MFNIFYTINDKIDHKNFSNFRDFLDFIISISKEEEYEIIVRDCLGEIIYRRTELK